MKEFEGKELQFNDDGYIVSDDSDQEPGLLSYMYEIQSLLNPSENEMMGDEEMVVDDEDNDDDQHKANSKHDPDGENTQATPSEYEHLQRVYNLHPRLEHAVHCIDMSKHEEDVTLKELLIRTLNSIRYVYPIILGIHLHTDLRNTNISIHGDALSTPGKKTRKKRCFLISEKVYDICTWGPLQRLQHEMKLLLSTFIKNEDVIKQAMKNKVDWTTFLKTHCGKLPQCDKLNPFPFDHESTLRFLIAESDNGHVTDEFARECDAKFIYPLAPEASCETSRKYDQSIQTLVHRLEVLIRKRFRGAKLTLYGSCVSNLSTKLSDVDMSLQMPQLLSLKRDKEMGKISEQRYAKEMKRLLFIVTRCIEGRQPFQSLQPVPRARVPVLKGVSSSNDNPYTSDGSLSFDICFLNDIAVANSSMLREYSLVDARVKLLMLSVKKWAQLHGLNNAAGTTISSYAWMNMVIFYVQCIGLVPNLQCPKLKKKAGVSDVQPQQNIDGLCTAFLTWSQARPYWTPDGKLKEMPITMMLLGFFRFYSQDFPRGTHVVSIFTGRNGLFKLSYGKSEWTRMCIEDPFENFSSHCPHDLTAPSNEKGRLQITQELSNAYYTMRDILKNKDNSVWLWPVSDNEKQPREKSQPNQSRAKKVNSENKKQNGQQQRNRRSRNGGGNSKRDKPNGKKDAPTRSGNRGTPRRRQSARKNREVIDLTLSP